MLIAANFLYRRFFFKILRWTVVPAPDKIPCMKTRICGIDPSQWRDSKGCTNKLTLQGWKWFRHYLNDPDSWVLILTSKLHTAVLMLNLSEMHQWLRTLIYFTADFLHKIWQNVTEHSELLHLCGATGYTNSFYHALKWSLDKYFALKREENFKIW